MVTMVGCDCSSVPVSNLRGSIDIHSGQVGTNGNLRYDASRENTCIAQPFIALCNDRLRAGAVGGIECWLVQPRPLRTRLYVPIARVVSCPAR